MLLDADIGSLQQTIAYNFSSGGQTSCSVLPLSRLACPTTRGSCLITQEWRVKYLVLKTMGPDINAVDSNGMTLAHVIGLGIGSDGTVYVDNAKLVVELGANLLAENEVGLLPVDTATLRLQEQANRLIQSGRLQHRGDGG